MINLFINGIGRLIEDAKQSESNDKIWNLRVAVNGGYKNSEGEWVKEVEFVNLTQFRGFPVWMSDQLKKGNKVFFQGQPVNETFDYSKDNVNYKGKAYYVKLSSIELGADNASGISQDAVKSGDTTTTKEPNAALGNDFVEDSKKITY